MDADDQHQETIHMGTLIDPIKAHCFKTCLSCSNRLQVLVASLGLGRLIGELAIEKCEALRLPAPLSPSSSRGVLLFERSKLLAVQMLQNEKRHLRKVRST